MSVALVCVVGIGAIATVSFMWHEVKATPCLVSAVTSTCTPPPTSLCARRYAYEEFNPYLFIKMLPLYASVAPRMPRIVLPKKSARRKGDVSLVLDLDETLVHCSGKRMAVPVWCCARLRRDRGRFVCVFRRNYAACDCRMMVPHCDYFGIRCSVHVLLRFAARVLLVVYCFTPFASAVHYSVQLIPLTMRTSSSPCRSTTATTRCVRVCV